MPAFHSIWFGNVSTLLALGATLVAGAGAAAGVSAAAMGFVKVIPGTLIPAAFLVSRESRRALVISLALMFGVSFALAPQAWLDYPRVLLNLLEGSTDYRINLAPANVVDQAGLPGAVVSVTRLLSVALGGLAVLASMWLARRTGGARAAALLGTIAMLIIPGTLWYHYLVVLLPFAAMVWPRAGIGTRISLLVSAVFIAPGLALPPVALAGGTAMALIEVWALWPPITREPRAGIRFARSDATQAHCVEPGARAADSGRTSLKPETGAPRANSDRIGQD